MFYILGIFQEKNLYKSNLDSSPSITLKQIHLQTNRSNRPASTISWKVINFRTTVKSLIVSFPKSFFPIAKTGPEDKVAKRIAL